MSLTGVCGAVIRGTSALGPGREGGRSLATRVTAGGGNLLGCGSEPQAGPEPLFCAQSGGLEEAEQRWRERAGGALVRPEGANRTPPPPLFTVSWLKLGCSYATASQPYTAGRRGDCRYPQTWPGPELVLLVSQTRTSTRSLSFFFF